MPPTDNSAVQITINVVDANSGEVVSRVTKSLGSMGAAGAGAGKQLKGGLDAAGEAGVSSGQKIAAGMDKAGGHSLTALDNVRLVRDDLGIRIPRAMEKVISQSKLAMGAIGALGSGLVALGAIEVFARIGTQVYGVYERLFDTAKQVDEFNKKLAESAEKKFFDVASIEDVNDHLAETNREMAQLNRKRAESIGLGKLIAIGAAGLASTGSLADGINAYQTQYFNAGDADRLNKNQEGNDGDLERQAKDAHDDRMAEIKENRDRASSLKGINAAQADLNKALAESVERRSNDRAQAQLQLDIINRANGSYGNPLNPNFRRLSPDFGNAQEKRDASEAQAQFQGRSSEVSRSSSEEALKAQSEARNANLRGEAVFRAQVDEMERVGLRKVADGELLKQDWIRERAALEEKYAGERAKRLQTEQAETERLRLEANTGGLTGVARVDAQRDVSLSALKKEAPNFSDPNTRSDREQSIRRQSQQQVEQEQRSFNDRLAQMDAARSDRFESETGRIQSAADRSVMEIQKAWREAYGQLNAMDARRVQSFAAVQAEIVKIQQDAEKQKGEAALRVENETQRLERQAARTGQPREREETQAILDAYQDRYQQLEQLRQNDAANADKYRRQELAEEAIKNGKLVDLQRQMRDRLAGELQGLFTNPIEALKRQGEQIASRAAASYILKVAKPDPGTLGTGGKAGGGLFGGIFDGAFPGSGGGPFGVRPFNGSKANGGFGPGPLTSTPTGPTTVQATSATIHVTSATITGLGGGGGLRTASYSPGGFAGGAGGGGFAGSSDAGSFSGPLTDQPSGSASGTPGASSLGLASSASSTAGASSMSAIGTYQDSQRAPGQAVTSAINGVGQFSSTVGSLNTLGKQLGATGDVSNKVPGLSGLSKLANNSKVSGIAGGALGLFSAFEGSGGIGGAFQGALSGAKFGSELGGPLGAGIGLAAGAVLGFIGFGARQKAAKYDRETVRPTIANELRSFEAGSSDYQTVFDDFDKLSRDAKIQTRTFGSGAKGYYDDTISPEIKAAQTRLTREQKAGRSQFGFSAAQFHQGGFLGNFGDMATSSTEGWFHGQRGEVVLNQQAAMSHGDVAMMMNSGASRDDLAAYYGKGATTAPAAASPADVNLHFHSADAKGARQLLMDNKHHLRAALNASYEENSGGYDVA